VADVFRGQHKNNPADYHVSGHKPFAVQASWSRLLRLSRAPLILATKTSSANSWMLETSQDVFNYRNLGSI